MREKANQKYAITHPEERLFRQAKARAKRNGFVFNICKEDIVIPEKCPVLGLELITYKGGPRSDHSPSIDRIIPYKGYTKDNICIVSWKANNLKSNGTLWEFEKIIEYIKRFK